MPKARSGFTTRFEILLPPLLLLTPLPNVPAQESTLQLDPLQVMGTRLTGASATDGPAPVLVLERKFIEQYGSGSLFDILRQLPEAQAAGITDGVAVSSTRGVNAFDLRGLGPQYTLILINGRRVTVSANAFDVTTFVDLNRIPPGMVERVEILKGGASAVYGADAVAGVVNIVTRRRASGGEIFASYGNTWDKDAAESRLSVFVGGASDRWSGSLGLDVFRRNALAARDRDFAANADLTARFRAAFGQAAATQTYDGRSYASPNALLSATAGQINGTAGVNIPGLPAGTMIANLPGTGGSAAGTLGLASPNPGAVVSVNGAGGTFDPARAAVMVPPQITAADPGAFNRYNFQQDIWLVPAAERLGLNATAEYALTPQAAIFGQFIAQHNVSRTELAPTPITTGNDAISVPRTNHYNPFGVDVDLLWRPSEIGPRRSKFEDTSWSALTGIRDQNGSRSWEAALAYSRDESSDRMTNMLRDSLVRAALARGTPDALNPFGGASFRHDPALIDSLKIETERAGSSDLLTADARWADELFASSTRPLRAAGYAEYRRESFSQTNDPLSGALNDVIGLGPQPNLSAVSREVTALAAEAALPLLRRASPDTPSTLELSAAARWESFSDGFTSGISPSVGLVWRPGRDWLFRVHQSCAFRAPTLPQLNAPQSSGFLNELADRRRPIALTGDPFDGPVSRILRVGGNPDLKPEFARVTQAGFVWAPRADALRGFAFEATAWHYDLTEVISSVGVAYVVANELGDTADLVTRAPGQQTVTNTTGAAIPILSGPNGATSLVQPGETVTLPGRLLGVSEYPINIARVRKTGVDLAMRHTHQWTNLGQVQLAVSATWVKEAGSARDAVTPLVNNAGLPGLPRWTVGASATWERQAWSGGAVWSFRGASGDFVRDGNHLAAYQTVGTHIGYTWSKKGWLHGLRGTLGVDDLFNAEPPVVNDSIGFPYQYVPRAQGRFVHLSVRREW